MKVLFPVHLLRPFAHGQRLLLALILLVFVWPAWAQVIEHKLTASDGAEQDLFGWSVSLSGDLALVGAPTYVDLGPNSGSAYVFERRVDGGWLEIANLYASDGVGENLFGHSVSLSGPRALIGAPYDDDLGVTSGSAYVFEQQSDGSWLEMEKLTASDGAENDSFGAQVSLTGDWALVGARNHDHLGTNSGAAYMYERQGDGSWLEVDELTPSDGAAHDQFGITVSISGDRVFVGTTQDDLGINSGSVYVFEWQSDGSWLEVDKLTASDGAAGDGFHAVSHSGDRAIVGAFQDDDLGTNSGSAYVFELQGDGSWLEVDKLTASDGAANDLFGGSVSISGDHAIVGSYRDDAPGTNRGSAYLFERQSDGTWLEVDKLTSTDGAADDAFGVSVSNYGNHGLIGAGQDDDNGFNSGSAYVFENIFPVANELPADLSELYLLSGPYPNPSNRVIRFSLAIAETQHVRIDVVSTLGQRVFVVQEGLLTGNRTHELTFDAGSLPSGVYLLRVTGEDFVATRTMTLLK